MKHKNSIVLCEMDNGTINLYVNGVPIFVDNVQQTPLDKIANCSLTIDDVRSIMSKAYNMIR